MGAATGFAFSTGSAPEGQWNFQLASDFGPHDEFPPPLSGRAREDVDPVAAPVRLRLTDLRTG